MVPRLECEERKIGEPQVCVLLIRDVVVCLDDGVMVRSCSLPLSLTPTLFLSIDRRRVGPSVRPSRAVRDGMSTKLSATDALEVVRIHDTLLGREEAAGCWRAKFNQLLTRSKAYNAKRRDRVLTGEVFSFFSISRVSPATQTSSSILFSRYVL